MTNGEGLYNVPSLPAGNYNIKVTAQGFSTTETKGVELLTGSNLSVDIQMSLGALQRTVSVQAQAALVESYQSTQGFSIRPTEVSELPVLNRTMAAVMTLIPGAREVAGTVSAHGTSSNWVSIGGGADQTAILRTALLHGERVEHLGCTVESDPRCLLADSECGKKNRNQPILPPRAGRSSDDR